MLEKALIMIGSIASVGFGVWHLFVPKLWNWYSYIDVKATELILAVRAINVFFSLSLVLFGMMNLFFIYRNKANKYSMVVLLIATCTLWLTRLVFQFVFPQGTINPILQYGMLGAFFVVFLCFFIPLCLIIRK